MNQTERRSVIAFSYESIEEDLKFQGAALKAAQETMAILMANPAKRRDTEIAEIRNSHRVADIVFGGQEESPYSQYASVYFLNESALKMCAELGLTLPVIGETTEQMEQYGTFLRADYLPISRR
jgi:uncharacterized Rossmann fold enzyme